jgi:hypothetical protein
MSEELSSSSSLLDWAVATRTLPGEAESGDLHLVLPIPDGVLIGVVDGLGHGPEAAAAAQAAVDILRRFAHESLPALFRHCHQGLVNTRGVVMSLATVSGRDDTLTWLCVGNVETALFYAGVNARPKSHTAILRGGVVGYQLPALQASAVPISRGDTLIVATDGVHSDFAEGLILRGPPQRDADRILAEHGKETDDALVLVARYLGDPP